MGSCDQCTRLNYKLYRANGHYVSLILQQDRVIRDGKSNVRMVEAEMLEHAIERAEHSCEWVTHALLAHCAGHHLVPRPDTTMTERFRDGAAAGKSFGVGIGPDL